MTTYHHLRFRVLWLLFQLPVADSSSLAGPCPIVRSVAVGVPSSVFPRTPSYPPGSAAVSTAGGCPALPLLCSGPTTSRPTSGPVR